MLFPDSALDVDVLMDEIGARECRSVGCWSLSADPALGTRLVARGFGWGWRPHWMAIDLDDVVGTASSRFSVARAAPPYAKTLPYAPSGPEPESSFRLGVRLRDKVVGQVVINPWDGVAGIYSMGVAPRVRRRGIGAALTEAACRLAIEHGCRHALLNATDAGEPLYRQAGFRSLGWGQTWWYSPGPEPTPRQIALTEAVGFGDLATLEALRPTCNEMADPLPGGETPLTLTLLTDEPAVAGYLLHLAIEHDRPAFVELALAHGVDPEARDGTFNATAAGWAEHFGHREILQRLAQTPKR